MKWPGSNFHMRKDAEWVCNICGKVANESRGGSLRKSARDFHNVARCARALKGEPPNMQSNAIGKAEAYGIQFYGNF